jgi:hypothetical protein
MNYKQNYENYIKYVKTLNREKGDGIYYELHHIIPESLNGTNNNDNLVLLTAREHFLAHYLLCKIYFGKQRKKMLFAFLMLNKNPNGETYINSKLYERYRLEALKNWGQIRKGTHHSQETKEKMSKAKLGKYPSKETRDKMSDAKKKNPVNFWLGKHRDEETRDKISKKKKGIPVGVGKKLSKEHRESISKVTKNRKWWNDGKGNTKFCEISPGENWLKGRGETMKKSINHL